MLPGVVQSTLGSQCLFHNAENNTINGRFVYIIVCFSIKVLNFLFGVYLIVTDTKYYCFKCYLFE